MFAHRMGVPGRTEEPCNDPLTANGGVSYEDAYYDEGFVGLGEGLAGLEDELDALVRF